MFSSFKWKIFILVSLLMILTGGIIVFYTHQNVGYSMMKAEKLSASNILELVELNIQGGYKKLIYDKFDMINSLNARLQNIASLCISGFDTFQKMNNNGKISRAEAQAMAIDYIRSVNFKDKEIFLFNSDGCILAHPLSGMIGRSLGDMVDIKGRKISQVMDVRTLKFDGDSAVVLWNINKDIPISKKLGFFIPYRQWGWTLGTMIDFRKIEAQNQKKYDQIIEVLEKTLEKIQIGRSGFAFLFNGSGKMIIPPPARNLEAIAHSGRTWPEEHILEAMKQSAFKEDPSVRFIDTHSPKKWEYEAKVCYFKAFDWYVALTIPVWEIQEPAKMLVTRQSYIISAIFIGSLIAAFILVTQISRPLRMLADYAEEVPNTDFTNPKDWSSPIDRLPAMFRDEVGKLAESFIFMKSELKKNIRQVIRTTQDQKLAAEEANRSKTEFLANMSHELRTPLNHILGFTELVLDKHFGDLNEMQEEFLTDVHQSGKHLLSLINDILDLSKVEAGKLELDITEVNLKQLLENSLTMIKEKAMRQQVTLKIELGRLPDLIKGDERKLKQILYNLLSNAIKFSCAGGEIRLNARLTDCVVRAAQRREDPEDLVIVQEEATDTPDDETRKQCLHITVSDTGIGIRPEKIESIFDPFVQVDSCTSRKYQGTGLGLSLTRRLVELHGGKIWATSQGEGKGTSVHFFIPIL